MGVHSRDSPATYEVVLKKIPPLALDLGVAAAGTAMAWLLRQTFEPLLGEASVPSAFLIPVALASWFCGFRSGIFALLLGAASLAALLSSGPGGALGPIGGPEAIVLALFLTAGLVIVLVFEVLHSARRRARASAEEARLRQGELNKAQEATFRLGQIVESSEDAILSKTLDGIVTSWNEAAERLYGYAAPEILGRSIAVIIPEDRPEELTSIMERLRRGQKIDHYETERVHKDGRRIPVSVTISPIKDEAGGTIGASAIARDISGRLRAERHRNARLAVAQVLAQSTRVEDAGPRVLGAICQNLGWSVGTLWRVDRDSQLMRCAATWIDPQGDYADFEAASRAAAFRSGEGLPGLVWAERHPQWVADFGTDPRFARAPVASRMGLRGAFAHPIVVGEVVGVLEFLSPDVREPNPEVLDLMELIASQLGLFIERRAAEKRLRTSEQELRRLERELRQRVDELAEADRRKNEFLATLAHELRNPLAPIRNSLQVLRLAGTDHEAQEQARSVMERQLEQLVRLVDDLLDLSRITWGRIELRKERMPLRQALDSAIEVSRPLIEGARHRLELDVSEEPIFVEADLTRLAQVFANLLNNAAKYTEPGGRIWVRSRRENGQVRVSIQDTGIGIEKEALPRVFDMFTQAASAKEARGGLGIGLALVHRLVRMHGGSVECRSEGPGRGSEFIVRLPLAAAPEDGSGTQRPAREEIAPRRILVVDDNQDSADSMAMMLAMQGHHTTTAYDGMAAVDTFTSFAPDVVLLDIGMPRMDGLEAAREIRGRRGGREAMLVAMTGWGQEQNKAHALEAGFDHFLTKPVQPDALQKLLHGAGSRT